jgi:protein-tyrosine phosphatase
MDQSVSVLRSFRAAGVDTLVCTPHLEASAAGRAPWEKHRDLLTDLQARAPRGMQLLSGWEIMLDVPGADLTAKHLTLGGSRAVLVEFPRLTLPPNTTQELYRIRMSGVVPIVAHPERYQQCTVSLVEEWRNAGAIMQMDVAAVLSSRRMGDFCRDMLAEGLIDLFASDTHGDQRSLGPAREWLREFGSDAHIDLLLNTNARRILEDREPLAVPPLVIDRGFLDRLRSIVLGKRRH